MARRAYRGLDRRGGAEGPKRLRASGRDGGWVMNRPPSPLTMLFSRHTKRRELGADQTCMTLSAMRKGRAGSRRWWQALKSAAALRAGDRPSD
jgi:hypothetical protein